MSVYVLMRHELHEASSNQVVWGGTDLDHLENFISTLLLAGEEWYVVEEWVNGSKVSERTVKGG